MSRRKGFFNSNIPPFSTHSPHFSYGTMICMSDISRSLLPRTTFNIGFLKAFRTTYTKNSSFFSLSARNWLFFSTILYCSSFVPFTSIGEKLSVRELRRKRVKSPLRSGNLSWTHHREKVVQTLRRIPVVGIFSITLCVFLHNPLLPRS